MRSRPDHPVVGVGAVVFQDDAVLLVKRAHAPLMGEWSLPGGVVELGESLEAAVAREIAEETGLAVGVGPVVAVFDRVTVLRDGGVEFHYVIIDYLCVVRGGTLARGSDAEDACFAALEELDAFKLTDKTRQVIELAVQMQEDRRERSGPANPASR